MISQLVYGVYPKIGWSEIFPRIFPDLFKKEKDAWTALPNVGVPFGCIHIFLFLFQSEAGRM